MSNCNGISCNQLKSLRRFVNRQTNTDTVQKSTKRKSEKRVEWCASLIIININRVFQIMFEKHVLIVEITNFPTQKLRQTPFGFYGLVFFIEKRVCARSVKIPSFSISIHNLSLEYFIMGSFFFPLMKMGQIDWI